MRLVTESFPVHARAGSTGHLSAAATATSDLDITVLTDDSGRHPAHQTGATAGRRPDRHAAGSAAPGAVLDRWRLRARGRFYNLGPRGGQHLDAAPADSATGRPPAAGTVASRGDRSASRAAWPAARVTLSGPDVLVELAHLYSNLSPGPETLAELRDRASARRRPANHAPVRQVQHRLRPARIEELIAAYRRGATAAALAVQFQIHRTTVAALLRRQKNRLIKLGVSERSI